MLPYDPSNWYWVVGSSTTQVYSSSRATYVSVNDATYLAWLTAGGLPTQIKTEAELWEVLAQQYPAGLPAGAGGTGAFQLDPTTQDLVNRLKTATPAQIDTWLDANTGNVTQVRAVLKMIVRVMALIVRRAAI